MQVVGPFATRRDAKTTLTTLECLLHGVREPDTREWLRKGRFFSSIRFPANCAQVIMAHIESRPQSTREGTKVAMHQRFAPGAAEHGPHASFLRDSGIYTPADLAAADSPAAVHDRGCAEADSAAGEVARAGARGRRGGGTGDASTSHGAKRARCAAVVWRIC